MEILDFQRYLTKKKQYLKWLTQIPDDVIKFTVTKRLGTAIHEWQKHIREKPKEKSYDNRNLTNSVTFPLRSNSSNIFKYTILFPKAQKAPEDKIIGKVRYKKHCGLNGQPKEITIIKEADEWYACIVVRVPIKNKVYTKSNVKPKQILGNDMNVRRLIQSSDDTYQKCLVRKLQPYYGKIIELDTKIGNLKAKHREIRDLDNYEDVSSRYIQLLYLQRRKLWRSINGIKKKYQYKIVQRLLDKPYVFYAFEKLQISKMMTYRKLKKDYNKTNLRKSIAQSSWNQIQYKMQYKSTLNGRVFLQVPPEYTSQTCSKCGCASKENRQSQSEFVCIDCGHSINADYNASINIKHLAKKALKNLLKTS